MRPDVQVRLAALEQRPRRDRGADSAAREQIAGGMAAVRQEAHLGLRGYRAAELAAGQFPPMAAGETAWHSCRAQAESDLAYAQQHSCWPWADGDRERVQAHGEQARRAVRQASSQDQDEDELLP